jgi:oligopeptide/dipeptide ABC transporter ATP-binding protein
MERSDEILLEIRDLKVRFYTYQGVVHAVDIERFSICKRESVGLVGETGCGKTVTSLAILGLIPSTGRIESGEIIFKGESLLKKSKDAMRQIVGKQISMIFQDPVSSLNPVFTIGSQVTSIIQLHQKLGKAEAEKKAIEMFELVRLPDPKKTMKSYPHELSGGMCQRVMIAMALSCNPDLLIADEPTTALDVTIQAQILKLMNELKEEINTSILLITHDFSIVAQTCDRVAVMYAGNLVEAGTIRAVFKDPRHPYTKGLLDAIPKLGSRERRLRGIEGVVPSLLNPPGGCRFHPRCPKAMKACKEMSPRQIEGETGHYVSCLLYSADAGR